jgi:hypothetical protein
MDQETDMTLVRRFVLIQGRTLVQYINNRRIAIFNWIPDEETYDQVLHTLDQVRWAEKVES